MDGGITDNMGLLAMTDVQLHRYNAATLDKVRDSLGIWSETPSKHKNRQDNICLKKSLCSWHTHLVFFFVTVMLLAGCTNMAGTGVGVTASNPDMQTHSGFLSDYDQLTKAPVGDGVQCWHITDLDAKRYDKVMIPRILVTLKDDQGKGIDPTDLKTLVDYFHNSLVMALKPQMKIVDEPGPGVLVFRVALTDLVPTSVGRSLMGTAIPYAFIAEAGSGVATGGPAGSTPYLGHTGIEFQFLDGATNTVLGECRDTQVGRKYAADIDGSKDGVAATWVNGYMNSFDSWAYACNAFDKWSLLLANRLAELRGVKQSAQ